jgi:hypothetical protein
MPDIHFITYGDEKYAAAKQRITEQANQLSIFTSVTAYNPNDIGFYFLLHHHDTLFQSRGGGYWLWKIYFILKKLFEIPYGDYLIYCDAGCNVNPRGKMRLIEYLTMVSGSDNGLLSFQMGFIEEQYTSSQIFNACGVPPDSPIRKSGQIGSTILVMRKCDHVMKLFIQCMRIIDNDTNIITDYYNKIDQIPEFIDNRHDQSILSVLIKLYGGLVIPEETWYEDFTCPQALRMPFLATRQRNS